MGSTFGRKGWKWSFFNVTMGLGRGECTPQAGHPACPQDVTGAFLSLQGHLEMGLCHLEMAEISPAPISQRKI